MDPTEVPTVVDTNPYAAPEAAISEAPPEGVSPARLAQAEATRLACRFHEGVMAFSGEYREVIALTRHVATSGRSFIAKVVVFLGLIAEAVATLALVS
jgi:hypothetical protein